MKARERQECLEPCHLCIRAFSDFFRYGLRHLLGRRLAAEIRRPYFSAGDDPLDRPKKAVVELALAEMVEHQRTGPDGPDWIGDAFARDVRGGTVDRLEHRRMAPLGIDVRSRRDAEAAGDRRAEV